jgi:hypothetical protein
LGDAGEKLQLGAPLVVDGKMYIHTSFPNNPSL